MDQSPHHTPRHLADHASDCACLRTWMTADEVAEYLAIPVATLYRWRCSKAGPPAARVGRWLRYRRSDVDAWVEGRVA